MLFPASVATRQAAAGKGLRRTANARGVRPATYTGQGRGGSIRRLGGDGWSQLAQLGLYSSVLTHILLRIKYHLV